MIVKEGHGGVYITLGGDPNPSLGINNDDRVMATVWTPEGTDYLDLGEATISKLDAIIYAAERLKIHAKDYVRPPRK